MNYTITDLGEIRMGCPSFGLLLEDNEEVYQTFSEEAIFITQDKGSIITKICESTDGLYLIIKGDFFTYIINKAEKTVSVYKATIRSESGIWSEETPIAGSETYHLNGTDGRHYYLQFPFIHLKNFKRNWQNYNHIRIDQINSNKKI